MNTRGPFPKYLGPALICYECRERFRSVGDWKRHRVGWLEARRCLSEKEMRAEGLRKDVKKRWHTPAPGTYAYNKATYDREQARLRDAAEGVGGGASTDDDERGASGIASPD